MLKNYKVFKKGTYKFEPFVIGDKKLEDTYEVSLSEYNNIKDLGCGVFKMENNFFNLTYPNDEVMMIIEGEVSFDTVNEVINLRKGDIIQVKQGLNAKVSTDSYVEIFFVSYPVKKAYSAINKSG